MNENYAQNNEAISEIKRDIKREIRSDKKFNYY